jgi:rhamnosyltransferase subunit B
MDFPMNILLTTLGSSGDVNPLLDVAATLAQRGHRLGFATSLYFKDQIERNGHRFHEVYPNLDPTDLELKKFVTDPVRGPELLHRHHIFPVLEKSYEAFSEALLEYDLVLSATLAYYAPLACRVQGKPWISVVLSPMLFFSAYDPPVLAPLPGLSKFYFSPGFNRRLFKALFGLSSSWLKPLRDLQKNLGFENGHDLFLTEGFSPYGTLALFSKTFGAPQKDWPANAVATGFCFFDEGVQAHAGEGLMEFLAAHPEPVLFTLGTTAVMNPGKLFDTFFAVQAKAGFPCIVLTGSENFARYHHLAADRVFVAPYLPYSVVMPHCGLIVHQGGVGTTAQVLRSGRPGIVMPNCNDQFDNAARAKRLGVSETLPYKKLTTERLTKLIERVQSAPFMKEKARAVANALHRENGPQAAADFVEKV